MDKDTIKHAVLAVLIGCAVTLVTDLSHLLIGYLQHLNTPLIGGASSTVAYLAQKVKHYT